MSSVLTERDENILRAARTVFARFGVAKTTMNDIAAEAGVARQTVYNAFPGKPDLLRATTRLAMLDIQDEMRTSWSTAETLAQKIDLFFEIGPLRWYDMIQTSPGMEEFFEGMGQHAKTEVAEGTKAWIAMLEETFKQDKARSRDPDVSLTDLAEFFYFASVNAKHSAESRDVLEARLRTIKSAFLNMLEPGPA